MTKSLSFSRTWVGWGVKKALHGMEGSGIRSRSQALLVGGVSLTPEEPSRLACEGD